MGWFERIFGVRPPAADVGIDAAKPTNAAFVTPQSLSNFAGASAAVSAIWGVLKRVADFADKDLWALIIAVIVGACIFGYNLSIAKTKPTKPELAVQIVVALINSFLLAAAALGVVETVDPNGG